MSGQHPAAQQLSDDLAAVAVALCGLLGTDLIGPLTQRAEEVADRLAAQLADEDPSIAAQTAVDIMAVLGDPANPEWWRTPLGMMVGLALGDDLPGLSRAQAAAILGVTAGTVAQWTHRGTLPPHPAGGISRLAVFQRLHDQN